MPPTASTFPEWQVLLADVSKIGLSFLLAVPIGWNREHEEHSAGIRTFPIVAMASCGLTLAAASLPGAGPDTLSRVLQGMVAGIGFVGGGAILRDKEGVHGTATAASVWSMGIAGACVGMGLYHLGVILAAINFITLKFLAPLKQLPRK